MQATRRRCATQTGLARSCAAFLVAVGAVISACGDASAPTPSPVVPSLTEAATVVPSETLPSSPAIEATSVPNETPVDTRSGETPPPEEPTATPGPAGTGSGTLASPAFRAISGLPHIPPKYTCDGIDVSPPLEWSGQNPDAISEFAIVVTDPDAGGFAHWVVARIPGTNTGLDEGAGDPNAGNGLLQGKNSFGGIGWRGPCPPAGATHHYHFALYAFASAPDLSEAPTASEVSHAGGTIAAELDALYGH